MNTLNITKIRKHIRPILICGLLLLLALCGCGNEEKSKSSSTEVTYQAMEIMAHVINDMPLHEELIYYSDTQDYSFHEAIKDNAISFFSVKSDGTAADEYIIIESDNVEKAVEALEEYREARLGDFGGYAPSEAKKVENAKTVTVGRYVALFISDQSQKVNSYFENLMAEGFELTDRDNETMNSFNTASKTVARTKQTKDGQVLVEEVEGYFDVYDGSRIVEAYKKNDTSGLVDEKEIAVYKACKDIIAQNITDDMTEFEKEKAIHDYMILNTDYDENALKYSTWFSQYSDQPYGCLIDKRAICLGYATTFKLFMDILDIECIIVTGSKEGTNANHAWNMVRLDDGNWYIVDVTWDDPVFDGEDQLFYSFFNLSEDELVMHIWDKDKYPTATGGKYSY